jgi:hypothetical protein
MREELQVSHNSRVTIHSSPLYEAAYARLHSHEQSQSHIPLTPLPPIHPCQAGSSSSFITLPIASSPALVSGVDSELDDPFDDPLVVDDSETEDNGTPEAEAIKTYPVVLIVWTAVGLFLLLIYKHQYQISQNLLFRIINDSQRLCYLSPEAAAFH